MRYRILCLKSWVVRSGSKSVTLSCLLVLFPDKQPKQLQKLSDTRWACQYRAINAVCWTFDAVIETLQDIASSQDHVKGVEARGLLHQVQCFKFLLSLIIFDRVLSCTFSLSEQLQDSKVNLAKAADL